MANRSWRDAARKTLGIYGYGRIGSVVAGYGKAFGMKVLVWSNQAAMERAEADGCAAASSKEAFFSECDVISLHLRLVQRNARNRDCGRFSAHEADCAARQYQPRAAHRTGRSGARFADGPPGNGGGGRL